MSSTTKEIWKSIPGYDDFYEVSNHGRVRSYYKGSRGRSEEPKLKKTPVFAAGYPYVNLHKPAGKPKVVPVHRLVAMVFIANPDNKPCVNHIDGNKENNYCGNLEWVTYSENAFHAYEIGLRVKEGQKGEESASSKLTNEEVLSIRKIYKKGNAGHRDLARKFGVSKTQIGHIVRHEQWTHI
jgi:hypothetical protein